MRESSLKPLGARWNFELKELFDRQRVRRIVDHRREVVDTVGEGDNLLVKLRLAGLLDAGVEIPDVRSERDDGLAVQLDDEAKHTVGGRMLRTHVEDHGLVADGV
jgi:hypothetical protein